MMGPPLGRPFYEHGGRQVPSLICCIIMLIDFGRRALIVVEQDEVIKALREQGWKNEASEEEAELDAIDERSV
ncbi:hypothetical protein BGX21_007578 [Mortierella sp. AD011]|nr:hypothetical protein BGX21_007575 [Mortierella sp. AD011]KAF9398592.1 hypothetical protein BGX21_007578 [Mortierella sp. AD011]